MCAAPVIGRGKIRAVVFVAADAGQMTADGVAEGERRADVDAAAGIVAAENRFLVAADGIQAFDYAAVCRFYPRMGIHGDAGKSAERAYLDFNGVIRAFAQGCQRGIGVTG